jgi:hypothetical protein
LAAQSSIGCFFLDSCVILSDILGQSTSRIEKLKKDSAFHKIPCYVSESVEQEIHSKVEETSDFLGNIVRETIQYHLEESRNRRKISLSDPMNSDDVKDLEDLFSWYHSSIGKSKLGLPSPVSLIEEWAISYLADRLDKKVAVTIDVFLRELLADLLKLTSNIEDSYDDLITFEKGFVRKKNVTLDPRIVPAVKALGIHEPDCDHIAAAIVNQTVTADKTVFVTLDFSSILERRDLINKQFGLECCDPLYALHHLV